MNIIYLNCGKYELDRKKIIPVIDTTFAVVKRNRIPYKADFFSGFLFTTAKVVSITTMIFFLSSFLLIRIHIILQVKHVD